MATDGYGGTVRTIQPADKGAPPTIRRPGKGALPTIRLATILGMLATAALLGVVSATAGLGVAGWIAGLATGSAATALLVTARMRSDQPAILPADWVTLTRTLLIAGVAGLVADSFGRPVSITALVTLSTVALLLLAESFGRNVIWLYRTGAGPPTRRALRLAITVLSVVLVSGVLIAPDRNSQLTPAAFVRIPVEGLALVAVALVLPARPRRIVAAVAGILFALLAIIKILDI